MKIRRLNQGDILDAAAIVRRNYSKRFEKYAISEMESMFANRSYVPEFYIAETKNRAGKMETVGLGGFAQSFMDYHVFEIFWINVRPENQGQGIGTKMVQQLIKAIKECEGAQVIQLTASAKNESFYQTKFGFDTATCFGSKNHRLMLLHLQKKKKAQRKTAKK